MDWQRARELYPGRWLVVEALEARSDGGWRSVEDLAVVDVLGEPREAMERYLSLRRQHPERELYVVHAERERLDIEERRWVGVRSACNDQQPVVLNGVPLLPHRPGARAVTLEDVNQFRD
jgi:hypothetical protein